MARKARVLMVCTGNICRSPAMHYWAARLWQDAAEVSSAGTAAEVGMDSTAQMRAAARARGLHYARHRPSQLVRPAVEQADLVLVATDQHAQWIAREFGNLPDHVFGIHEAAELSSRAPRPPGDTPQERLAAAAATLHQERLERPVARRSLDDPWGRDDATHQRVMGEIIDALESITAWADVT